MESNKTYNVTVENDSDILVTVATVATVEISGAPVNVGTGAGISVGILNDNLAFRTITTDTNITATQNALDVELSLSSDLTVDSITSGHIVPLATNTYTLGTPTNVWADLYLGDASLYIDGTKVLGSDATGDIDFTTDPGQSMNIQSGGDIILIPTSSARIQSLDVRLGIEGVGTGTVTSYGELNVTGDIVRGDTRYRDGAIAFGVGNATVTTDPAGFLHLDAPTVYLGSFSNYTQISGNAITGNLTGTVTGTVSDISNHTTDNLSEGSNLYYSDARVDARIPTQISSFANDAGYITDYTETDPIFNASPAAGITAQDRTDWTESYSWGDHSLPGYLLAGDLTGYATETYVNGRIDTLVDSAPGTLDTLNELAAALGDDPNFATTITSSIATKLPTADFDGAFDSRLSTKTTTDLTEGSNLYYSDARVDAQLSTKTTTDITEGSNLYYTDARVDAQLSTKTTTDITEGSNLYYTDARVDAQLSTKTTTDLTEGTNLYYTDARVDARIPTQISSFTNNVGYITGYTEIDPIFNASPAAGITAQNRTDWSASYSWGDHSLAGYLLAGDLTGYATETYVNGRIDNLVDSAPGTLDTLNELAAALGDDPNFATTVTQSIATKLPTADFNGAFDSRLSSKTTTDLTEGSNLYHTAARSRSSISLSSTNVAEMSYDAATGVFSYVSPTTVTASNAVEMEVRNSTGATIPKGAAVYISGHTGQDVLVELAESDIAGKYPAIGLAAGAIPNNTLGLITIAGELAGVDTSAFSENDVLYLSTTPGVLTNVRPSSASIAVQNIGKVAWANATNGIIIISGSGRANDVPNLDHGEVFIGDTVGYEKRQLVISDMQDVDTTSISPQNGDTLTWDSTNLEWRPAAASGGASSVFDLTDVSVGPPGGLTQGAVLQYNSFVGEFIPGQIPAGATTLNDLTDVQISGTPGIGQILTYDPFANVFTPQNPAPAPFTLDYSNDVSYYNTFTGQNQPSGGDILQWNFNPQSGTSEWTLTPSYTLGGGGDLDTIGDVSYYNPSTGQNQPSGGDVLMWQYNPQNNVSEWTLTPSYTLGGGDLDTSDDVTYYNPFTQQNQPQQGDVLQWNYNPQTNNYGWLLAAPGGGGTLDNNFDVSYYNIVNGNNQPSQGDFLQWNYNPQSNQNEWTLIPTYAVGGGPLDNATDVTYYNVVTQQTQPSQGDVLQWDYNPQTMTYGWILAPMGGGGGGTLDQVASDVYYPSQPNYQDTLNWDGANWVPGYNFNYSDSTLKTNITPITGALDKIRNLRGVRFEWTDPKYRGSTIGMIAQEIEVEFPEVVHTGTDDKKQVDYGSMVGALVEAIKEQQEQISALSARITELGG